MQWVRWVGGIVVVVLVAGCTMKFATRSPWDVQQIAQLSQELEHFRTLSHLQGGEADGLRQAQAQLTRRLASQIASEDVSIGFDERGLVVRLLDRVLFDSGKASIRPEAFAVLNQVAGVLAEEVSNQPVGIEGHTDNETIQYSGWKDNWELSLARARAVLTYLVQEQAIDPNRLSASGYGEYRPIASNESSQGRQMNRRVEIVVLPRISPVEPSGTAGFAK